MASSETDLNFHDSGSKELWNVEGEIGGSSTGAATLNLEDDGKTHTFTEFPASAADEEADEVSDTSNLINENKNPIWTFAYYQELFNVNTDTVLQRIKGSMIPSRKQTFTRRYIGGRPDMYGPFWICATLVLSIGVCGNLTTLLTHITDETYHYTPQFERLSIAAIMVYSYTFLIPLLIKGVLWWRKSSSNYSVVDIICTYGYSLFVFIPVSILLLVPSDPFDWIALSIAILLSGSCIAVSMWPALQDDSKKVAVVFTAVLLILHTALGVTFRLYFFSPISAQVINNSSSIASTSTHALTEKSIITIGTTTNTGE
nr:protein YIPF1 isoform X2 [Ciona intestinalis]|eukprot:XP_009859347.1 protein YIPF1 isoform X2 [Ciona intestinalis]